MKVVGIELDEIRFSRPEVEQSGHQLLGRFLIATQPEGSSATCYTSVLAEITFDGSEPLQAAIDALAADAIHRLRTAAEVPATEWIRFLAEQNKPL